MKDMEVCSGNLIEKHVHIFFFLSFFLFNNGLRSIRKVISRDRRNSSKK